MTDTRAEVLAKALRHIAEDLNTVHEPERGQDQRPPMVVALERWEACVKTARDALATEPPQPASAWPEVDEAALRAMWDHGFKTCRSYTDNWFHCEGEQKERRVQ